MGQILHELGCYFIAARGPLPHETSHRLDPCLRDSQNGIAGVFPAISRAMQRGIMLEKLTLLIKMNPLAQLRELLLYLTHVLSGHQFREDGLAMIIRDGGEINMV